MPQLVPHEGLCSFACKSPAALFRILKAQGWMEADFYHSENKIVQVCVTAEGFNITPFKSFRAACLAAGVSDR